MRYLTPRAVVLLLLIAMAVCVLLAPRPHRIDVEHFKLIQPGMSRAEVEAIFGAPAGKYDWAEADDSAVFTRTVTGASFSPDGRRLVLAGTTRGFSTIRFCTGGMMDWVSRHGAFSVHFDSAGRVSWCGAWPARILPPWQRWWQSVSKQ